MKTYNLIRQEILNTSFKITTAIAKGKMNKAQRLKKDLDKLIAQAARIKRIEKDINVASEIINTASQISQEVNNIKPYYGVMDDAFIRRIK